MKIIELIIHNVVTRLVKTLEDIGMDLELDHSASPIKKVQDEINNKPKLLKMMQIQFILSVLQGVSKQ